MTTIAQHLAAKTHINRQPFPLNSDLFKDAEADGEITWLGDHYVHACPLADDYLQKLTHQRVISHVQLDAPASRQPRVFHVSKQLTERPDEVVDLAAFDRDIAATMQAMVSTGDWDEALDYAQLKEWDALCACYERLKFNIVAYAKTQQDELERIYRETDANGEIPRQQVERINYRLQGLRTQSLYFSRKFKVALQERERAVGRSGIAFGPYLSIEERAKRSAQRWAQTRRDRSAELDLLANLPPARQRELLNRAIPGQHYKPRLDGVDADDGVNNRASLGTDID